MGILAVPIRTRVITEPRGDKALMGFSAGKGQAESEVNTIVRHLYEGRASVPMTVIAIEDAAGIVVGLIAYTHVPLVGGKHETLSDTYIPFIGVSERYRGSRTEARETFGDLLLRAALAEIERQADKMPAVWGLVRSENPGVQRLLHRHGFSILKRPAGDDIAYRPPLPPN